MTENFSLISLNRKMGGRSAAARILLMSLALMPVTSLAHDALKPGELQAYVEQGRSEIRHADEILRLFDAMTITALSAPATIRRLDDAELLAITADTAAINFYFPGSRSAAHSTFFAEIERRGLASELEVGDYHRTLIADRQWDQAKALAQRFPQLELEPLPLNFDPGTDSTDLKVWDYNPDSRTLERRSLGIEEGIALIIVSHPQCGFSRAAIRALESDPVLAQSLPKRRHYVAPTFGGLRLDTIRAWNTAHPSSRHVLVDRPLAWTFVQSWNTPQFLFLVDGKLVEQVEGWPDDGQKVALMKAARRAREIRAAEAVP